MQCSRWIKLHASFDQGRPIRRPCQQALLVGSRYNHGSLYHKLAVFHPFHHDCTNGDEAGTLLAFRAGLSSHGSDLLISWNRSTSFCSWVGMACSRGQRAAAMSWWILTYLAWFQRALVSWRRSVELSLYTALVCQASYLHHMEILDRLVGFMHTMATWMDRFQQAWGSWRICLFLTCHCITSMVRFQDSLSGPLPTEVGSLGDLNQLILSGNQLSGSISDSIGNCIVLGRLCCWIRTCLREAYFNLWRM